MRTAFKEWAVICRALASGRQRLILRKGGIAEPGGGFAPEHAEFLLMPTFLHQSAESIVPEARDLLDGIDAERPPEGLVILTHVATVRAARAESLAVAAVVLSEVEPPAGDPADPASTRAVGRDSRADLAARLAPLPVSILPHGGDDFLPAIDWARLAVAGA